MTRSPFTDASGDAHSGLSSGGLVFGSVCSGIEAASAAWMPLGWHCAFMSEIEAFPRAVLKHHYPETPLHGDFTTIQAGEYEPIDLLVGGTPCQSFSVAGLRGGLADDRGNLALEYLRLADRLRPRWLVWENVPGVLSSNGGRDFGAILGGMVELGYGFAYRVVDAQFFGVAQRRRRVFVVGHLGDWRRAAAVLFERASLSGNPSPRREKGQSAPTIPSRSSAGGGLGTDFDCDGGLIASLDLGNMGGGGNVGWHDADRPTITLDCNGNVGAAMALGWQNSSHHGDSVSADHAPTLDKSKTPAVMTLAVRGRGDGHNLEWREDGTANAILTPNGGRAGIGVGAVCAFNITPSNSNKDYNARPSDRAQAITSGGNRPSARGGDLIAGSAVRRLTPRECERLQGFPDDYTAIQVRGKLAADGPRYKALGNSMAVPCMAWIGRRIEMVEALEQRSAAT